MILELQSYSDSIVEPLLDFLLLYLNRHSFLMLRELLINKAERLANSEQASKKRRSIKKIVSEQKENLYRKIRKAKKKRI
ncbi:MAG: hypothetical protein CBC57_02390 [Euryarchaeota archaeon TMED97]|nr:MAG: hypothetical protein CBC57_02390 [Euryarchaeota archaeon TMED97]